MTAPSTLSTDAVSATDRPGRTTRGEIQALRAVAVLLVVLFHFWPGVLKGGYIGVDIFFVISGFLITGQIVREVDRSGTVRLAAFWARRVRRLLPAAFAVLAVTAVGVFIAAPAGQWRGWFADIAASAVYGENWLLAINSVDYLAADNAPSPVQHYWSLSVEEQFYLIWPLLVIAGCLIAARLARRSAANAGGPNAEASKPDAPAPSNHRVITVVLAVVTVASFGYSLYLTHANPSAAYFVTPTRAWQFGAGALLALWIADRPSTAGARARSLVSWVGLAVLLACALLYNEGTPFPGMAAVPPVLASAAIIWAGTPTGPLAPSRLMTWGPSRFLGDISYSLYLWHWPPLILLPLLAGHLGLWQRVLLLAAVIAVSAASKRWIEDPIRRTSRFGLRRPAITWGWMIVALAFLVALSGTGWGIAVHRDRVAAAKVAALSAHQPACFGAVAMDPKNPCHNAALDGTIVPSPGSVSQDVADYPDCWSDVESDKLKVCSFGPVDNPKVPQVVLVGDSHARAMLPAFIKLAEQGTIGLRASLKSSCIWTTGAIDSDNKVQAETCQRWRPKLQKWMIANADGIDLVVTTGFLRYLTGKPAARTKAMARTWRPVAKLGVPIAALRDNPRHDSGPSDCLAQAQQRHEPITEKTCAVSRSKAYPYPNTFGAAAKKVPGATAINLNDFYCRGKICPSWVGGVNVYRDYSHLTTTYTRTLAPYLLRELNDHELLRIR